MAGSDTSSKKQAPVKASESKTTSKESAPKAAPREAGSRTLRAGHQGEDVSALQQMLGERRVKKLDGKFGGRTERAVRDYQRQRGLPATGVVDKQTWQMLFRRP